MQLPKQNWENKLICFLASAFWGWIAVIKELLFVTWSVWEPAPGFSALYTKSKCVATLLMVLGRCRRGKRDHGKQVPGFWEGVGPRQAAPPACSTGESCHVSSACGCGERTLGGYIPAANRFYTLNPWAGSKQVTEASCHLRSCEGTHVWLLAHTFPKYQAALIWSGLKERNRTRLMQPLIRVGTYFVPWEQLPVVWPETIAKLLTALW